MCLGCLIVLGAAAVIRYARAPIFWPMLQAALERLRVIPMRRRRVEDAPP